MDNRDNRENNIENNNCNNCGSCSSNSKSNKSNKSSIILAIVLIAMLTMMAIAVKTISGSSQVITDKAKHRMQVPWERITIGDLNITNSPGNRSRQNYLDTIRQFDVSNNIRYQKRVIASIDGRQLDIPYDEWAFIKDTKPNGNSINHIRTNTYCNIFLWDVTKALGVEIPHYMEQNDKTIEVNANRIYKWLENDQTHWKEVGFSEALNRANLGYPTILAAENPGGIGHVAMVSPHTTEDTGTMYVAQAGGTNSNYLKVSVDWYINKGYTLKFYTTD